MRCSEGTCLVSYCVSGLGHPVDSEHERQPRLALRGMRQGRQYFIVPKSNIGLTDCSTALNQL
jgi:hypothetical protein